jgi:exodeoxyribonuclease-1
VDADGTRRFTLELLAPANGIATGQAHSATADVEATLALCRLIMERDGDCWSRFLQFAAKKSAAALIDAGGAFGAVRFRGNEPHPVAAVGLCSPAGDANLRVCLDLSADLDHLSGLSDPDLTLLLATRDSPVFRLRVNACPSLCEIWDVPPDARPGIDDETCDARAERARADPRLAARIAAVIEASREQRAPAEHVEEQLYDRLPMREDDDLQRRFHAADWSVRAEIARHFADPRSRQLGRRLVHLEAPDALDQATRARLDAGIAGRRAAPAGSRPWTTVADAIAAVDALGEGCPSTLAAEFKALA